MAGVVALGQGVHRIPTAGDYINSFLFAEPDGSLTLVDTGMFFAQRRILGTPLDAYAVAGGNPLQFGQQPAKRRVIGGDIRKAKAGKGC